MSRCSTRKFYHEDLHGVDWDFYKTVYEEVMGLHAGKEGWVVGGEPGTCWIRPSIVITKEGNYSDAHCFPWAYKELGIGKVVGVPVAGTCTFVWWERLHDGEVVFGVPNMAVTDKNGRPLENWQLEPDVLVANEHQEVVQGRDQQLERAVEELLKELEP